MRTLICALVAFVSTLFRSRLALQLENVALRHQLTVYQRTTKRPRISTGDRILWSWLSRHWPRWRDALVIVQPRTVIAWQRQRFRDHWAKLSKQSGPGRPPVSKEIRALIRKMSEAHTGWDSPRIVGGLRKLGIDVAKSTVEKYRVRAMRPPSPTWKAFLNNHARDLASIDFSVVPTVRFKILFVLVVLAHHRRTVVHFNVTEHPTAQWTSQQIIETFSVGCGTPLSTAGSGWYLRNPVTAERRKHGHRRIADCVAKPLAECLRGALDWQHPAGLSGSCHRTERASSETNPEPLF